jgi:haloalkane dehalogenase
MSEAELAEAMVERVMNIQTAFVGEGRHFIQQDQPEMIGRTLADWRRGSGGR